MFKRMSIRTKLLVIIFAIVLPMAALRYFYVIKNHKNILSSSVGVTKEIIVKVFNRIMLEELLLTGFIIIFSAVFVFILSRYILKPFKALRNASKRIMEGDYSARTNIKSGDEIGKTAEAFDRMAESIETWGKESSGTIASLSHEIKTPLNVIFSSVQLIDSYKNLDSQEFKRKVPVQMNVIRQNCYRMMRLTNNLLDICRHNSGYLKAKLTNYDIVELTREITLSVKKYAESKGINLVFESDMPDKTIACDPDMIERILLNLISNAIKFTDSNGTIKVKLEDNGDSIHLKVRDTGIGIPDDKLTRIFDVFNKDDNLVRNKEGTGLGLYLVKAFVEAHGGKIQVRSEKSVGSEFNVSFPVMVLNQTKYPSLKETQGTFKRITTYNGVQRVNIEFSDIYSCFDKETSGF